MKKRKNKLIANPPPLNEWTGPKFKEGWDHYRKKGENSLNESQITECIVPTTLLKTATTKMWKYNYQNKWFVDITQLMNKIFYKFKQNEANFEIYTFESNKVKIHELQRGQSVAVFSAIKKHRLIQIAFRVLQTVICYYESPWKRNSRRVPAIQRYTTRMNVERFYLLLHSIALRTLSILTLDTKYLTHDLYRNFFFYISFVEKNMNYCEIINFCQIEISCFL